MLDLVWLIPAFPLVGFAVLLVAGFRAVLLARDLVLTAVAEVLARRGRVGG